VKALATLCNIWTDLRDDKKPHTSHSATQCIIETKGQTDTERGVCVEVQLVVTRSE